MDGSLPQFQEVPIKEENNTEILGGTISVDNLGWFLRANGRAQL